MTKWQSELVHRLRCAFYMSPMASDDWVLRLTSGTLNRALIEVRMNWECLVATVLRRREPWMEE